MRRSIALAVAAAAAFAATTAQATAQAAPDTTTVAVTPGTLAFGTAPDVPALPGVTLNGTAQNVTGALNGWSAVDGTGSGLGWNVTGQGDAGALKSPVFKEYCTDATATNGCSTAVAGAPGPGYVTTAPKVFAANSLTLSSASASFTAMAGTTGTAPTHSCASACNVDSATPVKIAAAAAGAGMGTYQAASYAAASLSLAVPTTTKTIGTGNKIYQMDLTWSLVSGP
jgi:hypothetical protein